MIAIVATVCNSVSADAYKTLTFPDDGKEGKHINAYDKTWNATKGNDTWIISYFNSNEWNEWTYIKCGRNETASEATITTKFRIDKEITTVVLTIDNVMADKVNKIQLLAASDEQFGDILGGAVVDHADIKTGDLQIKIDGQTTANLYYKLIFDCAPASSNGIIQISKIQYFEKGNEPTAVNNITTQNEKNVIYNLNGQRLEKMQKGINIVNGNKVLVK